MTHDEITAQLEQQRAAEDSRRTTMTENTARLQDLANRVMALKPGQRCGFNSGFMRQVSPDRWDWCVLDCIMEKVVSASYEYFYTQDLITENVCFQRLKQPLPDGLCTYVSPDRRDFWEQRPDGWWEQK